MTTPLCREAEGCFYNKEKARCNLQQAFSLLQKLVGSAHLSEALAAVNGAIGLGLERNPSLAAAVGAHSSEVLTGTTGGVLASVTAGLAALGLVLETTLCVELLLTGGEYELLAALFAH